MVIWAQMNALSIKSRNDFPSLLNEMGLVGEAVEVGVYKGAFSKTILERWHGKLLHSIDPWMYQPDVIMDRSNVCQFEHNQAFVECTEALRKFKRRSLIHRMTSKEATSWFEDESLDFVYLDARHDYRSVEEDLNGWWWKVKVGGILAGHDYFDKCVRKNLVEVKRAVDNFFQHGQLAEVHSTTEDNLTSWYVIKEERHSLYGKRY